MIAAFFRLYALGQVPHGMTWDEAAIGYNGYAVISTRRDEWLTRLPVSFRSFGDYKAPLAIYINGLFTYLLGSELFVVRLPFALSGIVAVLGFVLLTKELLSLLTVKQKQAQNLSLVAGFLITFSPWHLHYSRIGFESGMALTFLIYGVLGLFYFLKLNKKQVIQIFKISNFKHQLLSLLFLIWATSFVVSSLYTYHSAKIVAPLLLVGLVLWQWQIFWQRRAVSLIAGIWGLILLRPLLIDSLGEGGARFGQASVFSLGLKPFELTSLIFKNYLSHLTPQFLIFGETTNLRHADGNWGVFFSTTFLLMMFSIIYSCTHLFIKKKQLLNWQKKTE